MKNAERSGLKMLVLGSRGSKLALWQAEYVKRELLLMHPDLKVEIRTIKTKGDKILDVPLAKIGDKGLFTREIEDALETGEVDAAVHSLKDLPTELPAGLILGAVMKREEPADVFISERYASLEDLPEHAIIGTSSLRRIAQIKSWRPDIGCYELRGNVDTRIRKMRENGLAGIILAYAGVKRLGLESVISQTLNISFMLPAVGQGAVALEIRADDKRVSNLVNSIADQRTMNEILAERSLLHTLGGGCQVPIGACAVQTKDSLLLQALVASLDGSRVIRGEKSGKPGEAERIGQELAGELMAEGAADIINSIH